MGNWATNDFSQPMYFDCTVTCDMFTCAFEVICVWKLPITERKSLLCYEDWTLRVNVPAEVLQRLLSGKCPTNVAETFQNVWFTHACCHLAVAPKTCESNSNMEYSYSYLCRCFFITYKDFFVVERNQVLKHWKLCFGANVCAFILWCLCLFGLLRLRGTLHCCFMSP